MEFNQCTDEAATKVLQSCAHMPSWIRALVQQRPYTTVEQLYEQAKQQAGDWQWIEVEQALAQHPRIGQKQAAAVLSEEEQQFSANEQRDVQTSQHMEQALLQANQDYEQQFGHIFLIRAAGRTGEDILSELQRRLNNTVIQEQQEVIQQLAEIAVLRLQQGVIA
nr:2-oxo-4-hydroxy-4-carboxy-5-ureidoimidazoline decarboxylase [Alkanindiges illinoisensis]